jgi:hypothetical protein
MTREKIKRKGKIGGNKKRGIRDISHIIHITQP